ncbi:MAG: serine hydrolase [Pseudomonadota bacterium]
MEWVSLKNLLFAGMFHFLGYTPTPDFIGEPWARHDQPESVGYSSARLAEVGRLADDMANDAIVVVVDGKTLWEYGDPQALSYLASVRKSLLAMLYGPYVEEGSIDLDLTMAEIGLDDVGGLLPLEREATIRDLIAARSGVYHEASNPGDNLADAPARGSQRPGSYYLYSNWDFNAAGSAFEMLTGESIYDAFDSRLARPLGLQDWRRMIHLRNGDEERSEHLAYHFVLSTRDMARLGELMLRDGMWNGERVLPATWTQQIISTITPNEEMNPPMFRDSEFGYGYMWWVWDGPKVTCSYEGAYSARGAYGQYITVVPKRDMVVAHKTFPDARTDWQEFRQILAGLIDANLSWSCQSGQPDATANKTGLPTGNARRTRS